MEIFFEETKSSYAARIYMLWHTYRQGVIKFFPKPSSLKERKTYFAELEKIYAQDAYNSLPIEGHHVSEVLIKQVIGQ